MRAIPAPIHDRPPAARPLVEGYGGGRFRIGGQVYEGAVVVSPEGVAPWPGGLAALDPAAPESVWEPGSRPDILFVGCGGCFTDEPPGLRAGLRARGVALEWMDTGAACRASVLLCDDERRIVFALVAVA